MANQASESERLSGRGRYWIPIFLGLWLMAMAATHFWLVAGTFIWWDIDTWLSSASELRTQARIGGKSVSELRIEEVRNLLGGIAILAGSFVGAIQLGNSLHRTALQVAERRADQSRLNNEATRLAGERHGRSAEIFSRAIEQLGERSMSTRVGAIFTLETLARSEMSAAELDQSRWDVEATSAEAFPPPRPLVVQIMDTLAGFVRDQSQREERKPPQRVPDDVETAVRVIAQSFPPQWRKDQVRDIGVDLSRTYLYGLNLPANAHLEYFNLEHCDLRTMSVPHANFYKARLNGADLTNFKFGAANLKDTEFADATLAGADFSQCASLDVSQIKRSKTPVEEIPRHLLPSYFVLEEVVASARARLDAASPADLAINILTGRLPLRPHEAYYTILVGAALADGSWAREEVELIDALVHRARTFQHMDPAALAEMRERIGKAATSPERLEPLVEEACKRLPKEMARTVFSHAVDIVFADSKVTAQEQAYLEKLAKMLELPEQDASDIVQAAYTRNKF